MIPQYNMIFSYLYSAQLLRYIFQWTASKIILCALKLGFFSAEYDNPYIAVVSAKGNIDPKAVWYILGSNKHNK